MIQEIFVNLCPDANNKSTELLEALVLADFKLYSDDWKYYLAFKFIFMLLLAKKALSQKNETVKDI